MPPRKQRRAPRRASKLAGSLSLSTQQEASIAEAWALFAHDPDDGDSDGGTMASSDLRDAFMALGIDLRPDEVCEIVDAVDPDGDGHVARERFVEVAALKLRYPATGSGGDGDGGEGDEGDEGDEGVGEDVEDAFRLFTRGEHITLADLRRLAVELREDVDEDLLRDMVSEAAGSPDATVDIRAFEGVMRRAGVF